MRRYFPFARSIERPCRDCVGHEDHGLRAAVYRELIDDVRVQRGQVRNDEVVLGQVANDLVVIEPGLVCLVETAATNCKSSQKGIEPSRHQAFHRPAHRGNGTPFSLPIRGERQRMRESL